VSGVLYLVSVPIGNLEDITLRAQRILGEVDWIACEDTRNSRRLLDLLGLARKKLVSVHDHNEDARGRQIVAALEAGECVALISDAGTPTVSDPGFRVVGHVIDAGLPVVPVPGVSAVVTALTVGGLPTDRFRFLGFPPAKPGALKRCLEAVSGAQDTLIFYVGPHHLTRFLEHAQSVFGEDRPAVIAREMTKKFEEFRRGTLGELNADPGTIRGEIVVLIGGAPPDKGPTSETLKEVVRRCLEEGYAPSRAAREAARRTGASRDEAYAFAVEIRSEEQN
jgi:16S rRNA (cytidine1402-2'-O)-methyltransferase